MPVALFAVVWAVIRASVQSITIDEIDTYNWFVASSDVWHPYSNNHILNTLLMWITTHAFGNSILAIRAPSLLGACLYVYVCYFLCRSITKDLFLQLPFFICLTYNPLIFDYMVAARGYGLADGFLLAAIAIPVWRHLSLRTSCVLASLALGLSFSANFSFAFVGLAVFLAVMAWAIRRRGEESVVRVVVFCALPGLFVALLICGYPLAHWPKGTFYEGAHSFHEMTQSLMDSSLYQLNPWFRDGLMEDLKPLLLPALGILCVCRLVVTRIRGWRGRFAAALSGIVVLSVAMNWLAFRFGILLLPLDRMGIYLVPLVTLIAGIIAAAPSHSVISEWLRRSITVVFICLALYFLACLRLTYFKEYQPGAEVKRVYSELVRLNHAYGVTDVGVAGGYWSSLSYYQSRSKGEAFTFALFDSPVRAPIYVLHGNESRKFINMENLAIIYRGKLSDIVIAVRPDGAIPATMIEQ
jgi:4-amino-4-deoxy-L-arabinose transferase-like glycosyltransferase